MFSAKNELKPEQFTMKNKREEFRSEIRKKDIEE